MILGPLRYGVTRIAQNFRFLSTTTYLSALRKRKDNDDLDQRHIIRFSKHIRETVNKGSKADFFAFIDAFDTGKSQRAGMLEFIYACLKQLDSLGLQNDQEVYKKLMCILPEGRYIPQNMFQEMMFHMPRHQECAVEILCKLEENGITPDREMRTMILARFGMKSRVFRKYARQIYWMQKFKNASPFPLPKLMPTSALQLAVLGIQRICPDLRNQITVYKTQQEEDESSNKAWIVSGQSPDQQELLATLPKENPIFVEGPFLLWLRDESLSYFMLRAEPKPLPPPYPAEYEDDVSDLKLVWFGEQPSPKDAPLPPTIHEQEDGVVLALCATGTSSRESLLSWIRVLQQSNPYLSKLAVAFKLKAPPKELQTSNLDPSEWTLE